MSERSGKWRQGLNVLLVDRDDDVLLAEKIKLVRPFPNGGVWFTAVVQSR